MAYHYRLYESVGALDEDEWRAVHRPHGDPFWDVRFVKLVAQTVRDGLSYTPFTLLDAHDTPMAVGCVSVFRLDAAQLASPRWRKAVTVIRRFWPGYLHLRIAYCGLPAMVTQSPLCIHPSAELAKIVPALSAALVDIAAKHGVRATVLSPIDAEEGGWLAVLKQYGYIAADGAPVNVMDLYHDRFDAYCEALRARYRRQIVGNRKRFREAGMKCANAGGGTDTAAMFTDALYAYYTELVTERAAMNLRTLPREFFVEFIHQFGPDVHFLRLFKGADPAGFMLGVLWGDTYYPAYACVNPQREEQSASYFNALYEAMDYAMNHGARRIVWGSTADIFKVRLGAWQRPSRLYVRVTGVLGGLFRLVAPALFAPVQLLPPQRVYRGPEGGANVPPAR